MPANTYAYIVPPVFPTAWLGDTIEISTRNWYNPLDESGLLTGCAHNYSSIKFPVSDLAKWDIISQPAHLKIGDEVSVTYKIYQNNIIRKSNALNVKCPFNDTTAIVLPL
jgi:hypothetical protein